MSIKWLVIISSVLITMSGCLALDAQPTGSNPLADKTLGASCDLTAGCSYGFRCDPVMEDGAVTGGVCLLDQGKPCNAEYDLCSRGLGCQESPEDGTMLCLPTGCMAEADCSEGTDCVNGRCVERSTCNATH